MTCWRLWQATRESQWKSEALFRRLAQQAESAHTMSQIVDHLADLTGFRDRDLLDVTLVGAMRDLLLTKSVSIYRTVGEAGQERWLTRAHLEADSAVATSDPAWVDVERLPLIDQYPHRVKAMTMQQVVKVKPTLNPQPPLTSGYHLSVFPVATDREVVAVLEIESSSSLTPEAQRMVVSILRIYRNFQALLDYSERDTLTGLLNRKTFDEAFLKASAEPPMVDQDPERRQMMTGNGTWLGVIDIDHFKRVNDTYGHLIGDEVLLLLSRLMRATFRFHDRLYRFGGEEFVVLMRCSNQKDASEAFERLRANVEGYGFPQVGRITISVGFTAVRMGDTPSAAFERADKAVYYAKGHGRNRVCSHADLVDAGELEDDSKEGDIDLF
jgi:diguanylate cyclase (GGDEF)-like protein